MYMHACTRVSLVPLCAGDFGFDSSLMMALPMYCAHTHLLLVCMYMCLTLTLCAGDFVFDSPLMMALLMCCVHTPPIAVEQSSQAII